MLKVNNKDIRMTSVTSSGVFIINLRTDFTHCFTVFIVNFEHVNASLVQPLCKLIAVIYLFWHSAFNLVIPTRNKIVEN